MNQNQTCNCGKEACFMYLLNDKDENCFFCEDCVPEIVKKYTFSPHGFHKYTLDEPRDEKQSVFI
jgi:hypothetical protein